MFGVTIFVLFTFQNFTLIKRHNDNKSNNNNNSRTAKIFVHNHKCFFQFRSFLSILMDWIFSAMSFQLFSWLWSFPLPLSFRISIFRLLLWLWVCRFCWPNWKEKQDEKDTRINNFLSESTFYLAVDHRQKQLQQFMAFPKKNKKSIAKIFEQ